MHSPHLLAQMSHFLMSLREQHQKLRMVQEATSNSKNLEDVDKESNTSRSSTTPITSPTSAVPTKNINNNNVTTEQPLDLSMSSKQKPPLGSSAASAKIVKHEPIINNNHHTVTEDENRNLIDVVSMDSPEGGDDHIRDDRDNDDILDEDDDDMLDDRHDMNDMDDNHSDIVG